MNVIDIHKGLLDSFETLITKQRNFPASFWHNNFDGKSIPVEVLFKEIDFYNNFGKSTKNLKRPIQEALKKGVFVPIRHCTFIIHSQTREHAFAE